MAWSCSTCSSSCARGTRTSVDTHVCLLASEPRAGGVRARGWLGAVLHAAAAAHVAQERQWTHMFACWRLSHELEACEREDGLELFYMQQQLRTWHKNVSGHTCLPAGV